MFCCLNNAGENAFLIQGQFGYGLSLKKGDLRSFEGLKGLPEHYFPINKISGKLGEICLTLPVLSVNCRNLM